MSAPISSAVPSTATELSGEVLRPGDPGLAEAAQGWNLAVRQHPALVVRAVDDADVQAAVRYAAAEGLGVAVMATGHGVVTPCDGGLLVDTSRMRGIEVHADDAWVRVEAGVRWAELAEALAPHGLTGLPGSSPDVGVVGYTLGGGFGWLGRRYGLSSHHLRAVEIVDAKGDLLRATCETHPDLFWALAGGTGNFGVVTALELDVHRLRRVVGGNLYYPVGRAGEVLRVFAECAPWLPREVTAAATVRSFPPLPTVPQPLRGRRLVALRWVHCGDPAEAEAMHASLVRRLGRPWADTVAELTPAQLPSISMDPVQPLAALSHAELVPDLSDELVDLVVEHAGGEGASPFVMVELRTLGGALRGPEGALSPMAHTRARYSLNAIGLSSTPEQERELRGRLDRLEESLRPHVTGEGYVNFIDSRSEPGRVRSAYTPEDWLRLCETKRRYDPDDRFRFNRNVLGHPAADHR